MLKTHAIFNLKILRVACCGLLTLMLSVSSYADSQRYLDYQYDAAGNIKSIRTSRNLGAPDVTNISPAFIHKESSVFMRATGSNLSKATVSVATPGVILSNVTNISETEIGFTLTATTEPTLGSVPITFTTQLGADIESIVVAERTPIVSTTPNPIILTPGSSNVVVSLTFDQPFASDQIYDVSIADPSIATIAVSQLTLLTGQTEVSLTVSAQAVGATGLEINQLSNFLALSIPVYVGGEELPTGNYNAISKSVGVAVALEPAAAAPSNTGTVSPSVGVAVTLEPAAASPSNTGTVSPSVGVAVALEPAAASPSNTGTVSPSVGVAVALEPAAASPSSTSRVSPSVGVSYGAGVSSVNPQQVSQGSSVALVVNGLELDTITAIAFAPSDVTAQGGSIVINPAGTQLTVTIDVPSNAAIGFSNLIFTTPDGDVSFGAGYIEVTN